MRFISIEGKRIPVQGFSRVGYKLFKNVKRNNMIQMLNGYFNTCIIVSER